MTTWHGRRTQIQSRRLNNDRIRDMITDYRCAKRDGLTAYAAQCLASLRDLWRVRR